MLAVICKTLSITIHFWRLYSNQYDLGFTNISKQLNIMRASIRARSLRMMAFKVRREKRYCSLNDGTEATMSAKNPWNTHTVLGIFHPRPIFASEMTIVSPLPPSYSVESIAEALSYFGRHFFLQCYWYHLQTTLFHGGDDFVVRPQHKSQEVFQGFWQAL